MTHVAPGPEVLDTTRSMSDLVFGPQSGPNCADSGVNGDSGLFDECSYEAAQQAGRDVLAYAYSESPGWPACSDTATRVAPHHRAPTARRAFQRQPTITTVP
jgi:hypothetical protein